RLGGSLRDRFSRRLGTCLRARARPLVVARFTAVTGVREFRGHANGGQGPLGPWPLPDRISGPRRASDGGGEPALAGRLVLADGVAVAEGEADVVQALHQAPARVVVDLERGGHAVPADLALLQVDGDLQGRVLLDPRLEVLDLLAGEDDRQQPHLRGVVAEDVPEARRDDDPEPVLLQRPDGVLAGRAGAEVGTGDQDARALVLRLVQDEVGVVAPGGVQAAVDRGAADLLEPGGGDDVVGVDVAAAQGDRAPGAGGGRLHGRSSVVGPSPGGRPPRPAGGGAEVLGGG